MKAVLQVSYSGTLRHLFSRLQVMRIVILLTSTFSQECVLSDRSRACVGGLVGCLYEVKYSTVSVSRGDDVCSLYCLCEIETVFFFFRFILMVSFVCQKVRATRTRKDPCPSHSLVPGCRRSHRPSTACAFLPLGLFHWQSLALYLSYSIDPGVVPIQALLVFPPRRRPCKARTRT